MINALLDTITKIWNCERAPWECQWVEKGIINHESCSVDASPHQLLKRFEDASKLDEEAARRASLRQVTRFSRTPESVSLKPSLSRANANKTYLLLRVTSSPPLASSCAAYVPTRLPWLEETRISYSGLASGFSSF